MLDDTHLFCDVSHAPDSPGERLASYRRLFTALTARTPLTRGVRFHFDPDRLDRPLLDRLVGLERACCPFLLSTVATSADEVHWDVAADQDDAVPFVEALRDLPDVLGQEDHEVIDYLAVPIRVSPRH